jgi:transposase-like protein
MESVVKRYSMRFRQRVVERMQLEKNIVRLSRELGLDRSMMYIWKRKLEKRAGTSGRARSTCGIGR